MEGYSRGVKIVPFEKRDESEVSASIPDVSETSYGELFFAANWAVLNRPWENAKEEVLFEITDSTGKESWHAFLNGGDGELCVLLLVRKLGEKISGEHDRLEVQFIASDFLQGHDYELNVRYAPESWDACECDVIVLRAFAGGGEPEHPNEEQVKLLREALVKLSEESEFS